MCEREIDCVSGHEKFKENSSLERKIVKIENLFETTKMKTSHKRMCVRERTRVKNNDDTQ